jgi:anti-anti-sigma regulatory factor
MITVNKQQTKDGMTVELSGAIEENVHFEQMIGPVKGELIVNCRGVTRINSVGVKTWMKYFQGLKTQGVRFKFVDCSYPIIEQLNMISNFACGGEVYSILLPYSCIKCQSEFVATCKTAELRASGLQVPQAKCEKPDCGAQFDDDPEEYFYFLED